MPLQAGYVLQSWNCLHYLQYDAGRLGRVENLQERRSSEEWLGRDCKKVGNGCNVSRGWECDPMIEGCCNLPDDMGGLYRLIVAFAHLYSYKLVKCFKVETACITYSTTRGGCTMVQVTELWQWWHHYFTLVVQWGMKLCFIIIV